jgi:glycosyltransferase involved in cell wall biosynthesis
MTTPMRTSTSPFGSEGGLLSAGAAPAGTQARPEVGVALLTGGGDRHYAFGLTTSLVAADVSVDCIGGDEVDSPEMHTTPGLTFYNFRQSGTRAGFVQKAARIATYYARLVRYAATAGPRVFHILWNNKFEHFDRTLLTAYYKMLRKKIVLTAHNVNAGTRDASDSTLNRLTLRIQYQMADHIFVHTQTMKDELSAEFGIPASSVSVIRYGVNNAVPCTGLSTREARERLGIEDGRKVVLFFGNIAPYKGLEYLIRAFESLAANERDAYRLIVAGRFKKGSDEYSRMIERTLAESPARDCFILRTELIPDEDIELYFKAADVLALPYTHIFQSGILFLGYSFGLPVVASDVGSLRQDIVEGETGFLCRATDPSNLAATLVRYFASPMFSGLASRREYIQSFVEKEHSWANVARETRLVYTQLLDK